MKAEAAYPQTRINEYIIGKHGNKTTKAKDTLACNTHLLLMSKGQASKVK